MSSELNTTSLTASSTGSFDPLEGVITAFTDRSDSVVEVFTEYSNIADKQLHGLWFAEEIDVEKDKQCILTELTPSEKHAVLTTLRLFTLYEVRAGDDYWAGRFLKIARGPEFTRLARVFSMIETAVHKPFYQKINKILGLDTDNFYKDYVQNPVLQERVRFIDDIINSSNDLLSVGGFTFVEGGILYSAFGYLKHFNANGGNRLKTTVSGIDFSLGDENLHAETGALFFRHLTADAKKYGVYEKLYGKEADVHEKLQECARKAYEHEAQIIDMMFEEGDQEGCSAADMRVFVQSRMDICLANLGVGTIFNVDPNNNPIARWFYSNIQGYKFVDFFHQVGKEYSRGWSEDSFEYATFE